MDTFEPFEVTAKLLASLASDVPAARHKVAGFDYRSGMFWDQVTIETRGQSSCRITCIAKSDGTRIRQIVQELET